MVVTHGSLRPTGARCALTIGNFDGVHRGHRALLDRVAAKAAELRLTSCVLTFEPHPREFFARESAPARITRLRDKLELLAAAGVQRTHVARFDAHFASLAADDFVRDVVAHGLGTRWLLVGRDFRFGRKRAGDFTALEALAPAHGFGLEAMADVELEGGRVSSSAVRRALAAGDLQAAERLLGHPYTISGRVAHGAKLGRGLGFPTANIVLRRPPPISGIFAVDVAGIAAGTRAGVASVGRRPTVNPVAVPLLEVHLFDFAGELYGEHLKVRFLKKLRDEAKYDSLPALRDAIARDVRAAKDYFETHG